MHDTKAIPHSTPLRPFSVSFLRQPAIHDRGGNRQRVNRQRDNSARDSSRRSAISSLHFKIADANERVGNGDLIFLVRGVVASNALTCASEAKLLFYLPHHRVGRRFVGLDVTGYEGEPPLRLCGVTRQYHTVAILN